MTASIVGEKLPEIGYNPLNFNKIIQFSEFNKI